uniref:NOTCH regulated ankyrin repeat protein n=1 Tax=Athene cunicularia TaxID=194338 RepID=A0A663NDE2_ATHCN
CEGCGHCPSLPLGAPHSQCDSKPMLHHLTLLQSVIDGNLELVKLLVKFGADIRLANRDGWSALHIAAFGGHQDIVLYLITKAKYSAGAR